MKKRSILLVGVGVLLVVALAVIVFVLGGGKIGEVSNSLSGTMMYTQEKNDSWTISANTLKGHIIRRVDFSSDNLAALHVDNTNSGGTVSLKITQGDIEKTFDISGDFSQEIDMSGFKPGRISLYLDFEGTKDVKLDIKW